MPGWRASFAAGLAEKLNVTPFHIRWEMYLPEALQYLHAHLVASGAWVIAPRAPIAAQIARLASPPSSSDTLLGL
jgi:hypothetical protein